MPDCFRIDRHLESFQRPALDLPRPPLWLPGVFPFFRLAALAAGVPVCFPFPFHSHFSGDREPMSDSDLFDAVAQKTGRIP